MDIFTVGIVSDTHRHLPEGALAMLRGGFDDNQVVKRLDVDAEPGLELPRQAVDLIVHAGDIGELEPLSQHIIDQLEEIAPVRAVLGNRDVEGYWTGDGKPVSEQMAVIDPCGVVFAIMHRPEDLEQALRAAGIDPRVRVHGHTHVPKLERRGQGIIVCPGSPSKPRGDWPQRTVALVHLKEPGKLLGAEIVKL